MKIHFTNRWHWWGKGKASYDFILFALEFAPRHWFKIILFNFQLGIETR